MEREKMFQTPNSIKFKGELYLDETNNFRNLYLTEAGANNKFENLSFVLGGIGCIKKQSIDYAELLKVIGLKNVAEFKFKTLCDGSKGFYDILKSIKLNKLLYWLNYNKNFVLNLFSVNYAFYLLIDIVDEALERYDNVQMYMMMHLQLKNALYISIKPYFNEFISLMYKYEYPNVTKTKIKEFSECVMDFVERLQYEKLEPKDDFSVEFLRQIIKNMRKKSEFLFLSANKKNEIVSNYSHFYSAQILKLPNAQLIFDNEDHIKSFIKDSVVGKSNYRFADSKSEPFLQVSDVIVGFVSKLMSFLEEYPLEGIKDIVKSFNTIQKDNIKLFFELERHSAEICEALLQHIQPAETRIKMAVIEELINN